METSTINSEKKLGTYLILETTWGKKLVHDLILEKGNNFQNWRQSHFFTASYLYTIVCISKILTQYHIPMYNFN